VQPGSRPLLLIVTHGLSIHTSRQRWAHNVFRAKSVPADNDEISFTLKAGAHLHTITKLTENRNICRDITVTHITSKGISGRGPVHIYSVHQGCGPGTQASGSSSRHLNFLAPAPTSRSFGSGCGTIRSIENYKTIALFAQLADQTTISVELEPKLQIPALPSERFWLRRSKIAWAPGPQPWRTLIWVPSRKQDLRVKKLKWRKRASHKQSSRILRASRWCLQRVEIYIFLWHY